MKKILFFSSLILIFSFFLLFCPKSFAANPPVATQSSLLATTPGSDTVPADGVTMASMTAKLKDFTGAPVAGDTIALSAPGDILAVFSPLSAVLDAQGVATFSARSTHVGTDAITVTDSTAGVIFTALGNIFFTAIPTPSSTPTPGPTSTPTPTSTLCIGNTTDPPDAPNLYAIIPSQNSALLYFVEPKKAFTAFTINYGLSSLADLYAVNFKQGTSSGAITYQINSLTSNQRFYFRVRAINGCAPGDWSSTLNAFIGPIATQSGSSVINAGSNIDAIIAGLGIIFVIGGGYLLLFI